MKKSWEVEYIHISSDKPVDIRGYNTMASLRSYKMSDAARLVAENDTIAVYDEEDVLVYQNPMMVFWTGNCGKSGFRGWLLSQSPSIPIFSGSIWIHPPLFWRR